MLGIIGLDLLHLAIPVISGLFLFAALLLGTRRLPVSPPLLSGGGEEGGDAAAAEAAAAEEDYWRKRRMDRIVPAVIAVGFYLFGLWRLGVPNEMIFDEVHHARTAAEFVAGLNPHEWTHPHFSKLMVAGSMMAWDAIGGNAHVDPRDGIWTDSLSYSYRAAVAWRFAPLVFGSLSLVVMYHLAVALFEDRRVATLATVFLALDGCFFVMSRVAMTNIFTVFFILLATLGVARHFKTGRLSWLWLTGFAYGGALSSRWSTVYAWVLTLLALAVWRGSALLLQERRRISRGSNDTPPPPPLLPWLATVAGSMFVLPALLYALSYVPFVLQGAEGAYFQKLFTLNYNQHGWGKVWTMQKDMYDYHTQLRDGHTYNSPPWSWPLMLRPVWYYWHEVGQNPKRVAGTLCIGNAFIWWATLPSLLAAIWVAWRERKLPTSAARSLALIALLGIGQWALWGVKARSLNFMHYMFESIPFVCLALAYLLMRIWDTSPTSRWELTVDADGEEEDAPPAFDMHRAFVVFYALLVIGWFVFYYPILSALPISERYFQAHLWLGRPWI